MNRLIWITILVLSLVGCSTITPSKPTQPTVTTTQPTWQERELALKKLQRWSLRGKIAAQTAQDSGSATLDWQQNQSRFNISLMGPLGSNSVKLVGSPGQVTMIAADGKRFTASSPEELLAKQWGWDLPVSYLTYWVRGLPVPGIAADTQLDGAQRLAALNQQGWRVEYLNYTHVGSVDLPGRIAISSARLKVKMVIYQWG